MTDRQHDRVPVNDRVAVAEFRADLQRARDAGDLLDQDFADHAGVGSRAAGGQVDFFDFARQARGQVEFRQADAPGVEVHTSGQGIGQRAHLLVDFLLHEVTVFPFFGGDGIPRHAVDLGPDRRALERFHTDGVARDHRHLT